MRFYYIYLSFLFLTSIRGCNRVIIRLLPILKYYVMLILKFCFRSPHRRLSCACGTSIVPTSRSVFSSSSAASNSSTVSPTRIVGGQAVTKHEFPWQVCCHSYGWIWLMCSVSIILGFLSVETVKPTILWRIAYHQQYSPNGGSLRVPNISFPGLIIFYGKHKHKCLLFLDTFGRSWCYEVGWRGRPPSICLD